MQTLSFLAVVDELVAELRERRSQQQDGYVALARAILTDDAIQEQEFEEVAA